MGERRRGRCEIHKAAKRHIVPDDFEWRALVKEINEYRKQVIDEDGCVDVVKLEKYDEAMNEMHSIAEVEAFTYGFRLGVRLMIEAGVSLTK